ncbi:4-hydroxy-3-methylbut-2-enyl diphosphate reductase [Salidesulfovibrio onnuriiensis]|uniref:4-hydroxy-3-methylbut-2-enyl diphosphate reductase n=1 Tax=Salidesulfovibrio onnuriiensis TaxID=2583823 RepID=UPI0011C8D66C|nr:4-hydroxy-3-methylbut-2-enyl diphosphate reductase [Salidesulfovibrio onnuriiensis]
MTRLSVRLAETAGFCMGVDLALQRLDRLIEELGGRPIHILGPIIHNPQVLERYARKGVVIAEKPCDVPEGGHVVIRAHGIPREVEAELEARNITIKDATCPKVKKAQVLIARHTRDGRHLLLFGEEDHPEVRGLMSYAAGEACVFGAPEELDKCPLEKGGKYVLAAQTTQDREQFDRLAAQLDADPGLDVTVLHTICDATKLRQKEAMQLAREVDAMVVVGGKNSGNTRRLAQVVLEQGTPVVHVETAEELDPDAYRAVSRVGVTAGASTPRDLVEAVIARLESF